MIACFSFGDIEGAKIPDSSRREKTFVNYSKAATSSNRQKPYYWDIVQVRSFCNVEVMATTVLLCAISIAPSVCEQSKHGYDTGMGIPAGFACYWRSHHCHAHSTTHTTTDSVSNETGLILMSRRPLATRNGPTSRCTHMWLLVTRYCSSPILVS